MTDSAMKAQVIERAAQLGGPIPNLSDGDIFKIPHYEEEFVSERFPSCSGRVALRFPSFGDEVEMDRLSLLMGDTLTSRVHAAFITCLEAAPATWFRPGQGQNLQPVVAVDRIPDSPALVALYGRWIAWRDNFRFKAPAPAEGGAQPTAAPALGNGTGA